jgi:outer membrane protein insertion porin family
MRKFLRSLAARIAIAAAILTAAPWLSGTALAQAGARVSEVEFRGNRTLDSEVLRQSIRTKKGQLLDESLLSEDVKTLYELFGSVHYETTQDGDQVKITFIVTENALAAEVVLHGVSELSEKDVAAVMDTTRGRPVADFRLANDARKIERLYRMKGFHFVQVTTELSDAPNGKLVRINVLEGPKVSVESITFKGNDHINKSKLTDSRIMATQETGFLGLWGADFVEETLVKDRGSIVQLYRSEGYLNVQVRIAAVDFSEDRRKAYITIEIEEGPAFTVGVVSIIGADAFPGGAEALRQLLRVTPGKRYRIEDILKSLNAIDAAYHQEGYFAVSVDFEDKPTAQGTVDLDVKIDEQSKVRVRDLIIVGNEITQDKVIRRESGIYPGEVLNQNEVRKTENRLKSLGYFTGVKVDVLKPKEGDDPSQRDVRIAVDDSAKTGQVKFAVGASSDLGLLGSFTVTKRNFDWQDWPQHFGDIFGGRAFTGAGQTFQLELTPGTSYSQYRLAYTEPWLFDKPIEFGWDLFFSKFTRFDYDVDRAGLDITLGRRFVYPTKRGDDMVLGVSGTTRIESVDLSGLGDSSSPTAYLAEGRNSLISERFNFRLTRLDNSANPTDGWSTQFTPEIGFAGDIRLAKATLEGRRYFTVGRTEDERVHTIAIGSQIGYARALGSSVRADPSVLDSSFVPTYESFFAGGQSTIRGFSYGGAGPHGKGDPFLGRKPGETQSQADSRLARTVGSILDNDGDPMGGNVLFLANVEYGFPLYEDILRGVAFIDSGMVRDSMGSSHGLSRGEVEALQARLRARGRNNAANSIHYDDGGSFFSDLRASVGFGVRIKIPGLGQTPIALDFGFPVKERNGDDRQVLSFSIAQNF